MSHCEACVTLEAEVSRLRTENQIAQDELNEALRLVEPHKYSEIRTAADLQRRNRELEAQLLAAREERHQIEQEAQRLRGALERIQNLMQHPDEQLAWLRIERAIEAALLPCDPPQETTTEPDDQARVDRPADQDL